MVRFTRVGATLGGNGGAIRSASIPTSTSIISGRSVEVTRSVRDRDHAGSSPAAPTTLEKTMGDSEFREFNKIPRLNRDCIITEKIDGTNAQIFIDETGLVLRAGSRSRWITPTEDNHGFAKWVEEHREELLKLGPGRHFGEWWGFGINRGYGLTKGDKRFSLFNTSRWKTICSDAEGLTPLPGCCGVVPILYSGPFTTNAVENAVAELRATGSVAAPGFMKPEGVVVYHVHGNCMFKVTLENDEIPKSVLDKQRKV